MFKPITVPVPVSRYLFSACGLIQSVYDRTLSASVGHSIYEKLLFFVGGIFHEEEKIGMVSFETTHKRLSIHVFLISLAQVYIEKRQYLISFCG